MWRCTVHTDGGTRTATERMCTILQYFFKSRSWRHFYAVIRERLAENCRGRTTTIICTRTNAPKYILESHRLHFGSICDQNGRNFEPCFIPHLCPFSDKRLDLFPGFMKLLLQKYAMGWDWLAGSVCCDSLNRLYCTSERPAPLLSGMCSGWM